MRWTSSTTSSTSRQNAYSAVIAGMSRSLGLRQAAPMQKRDAPLSLAARAAATSTATTTPAMGNTRPARNGVTHTKLRKPTL